MPNERVREDLTRELVLELNNQINRKSYNLSKLENLILSGADVNDDTIWDDDYEWLNMRDTFLLLLRNNYSQEVIALLLRAGFKREDDYVVWSYYSATISSDIIDNVKLLLIGGFNPNVIVYDRTPLMNAVMYDVSEIAKLLIMYGVDVNLRNSLGKNAYDIAIEFADDEIINYLGNDKIKDVSFKENIKKLRKIFGR